MNIFVLIILIVVNGFLVTFEISLISLNDSKIRYMDENGDNNTGALLSLLSHPNRIITTFRTIITFINILIGSLSTIFFLGSFEQVFNIFGLSVKENILKYICILLLSIIISYFILIFVELIPKKIAYNRYESIALKFTKPIGLIMTLFYPFAKITLVSLDIISNPFVKSKNEDDDKVTEEEIRMLVDAGEFDGSIEENEKEFINNIFEFNDKIVADIMTHRTEIDGININSSLKEIMDIVDKEKYSRFPIYNENIDDIVGVLYVKDLLKYLYIPKEDFNINDIMRSAYYVPSSKNVNELFLELKKNRVHLVVVIDEYGGTAGLLTLEDVIEEILGDIDDEYDETENKIEYIDDKNFIVSGSLEIENFEDLTNIILEPHDFDTIGGFVIGLLGRIPEIRESPLVMYKDMSFKVIEMEEKRISKIKICVNSSTELLESENLSTESK